MAPIPTDIEKKLKAVLRRIEEAAAFDGVDKECFDDSTSLKSLAKLSGMSERSLRDWFKIYTGQRISQYASRRRAEYAARIFRLFPDTAKSDVSKIIGLSCSQSLYPFMRKNGVSFMEDLRDTHISDKYETLEFRTERLPNSIMFYTQDAVEYSICSAAEFEAAHWERIEKYVQKQFPEAQRIGDVGFAIDRYIENKVDEGVFVCGILYKNISTEHLTTDLIGEIGWRAIFSQRYAIFNHKGDYARLSDTYYSAIGTLLQKKVQIDKSTLIMEQYLNSPADTPSEELMTEIWVPIEDSF